MDGLSTTPMEKLRRRANDISYHEDYLTSEIGDLFVELLAMVKGLDDRVKTLETELVRLKKGPPNTRSAYEPARMGRRRDL